MAKEYEAEGGLTDLTFALYFSLKKYNEQERRYDYRNRVI